ncbi:MAG: hypothetical protein J7540_11030 [Roseofilum sp. SID2]|uniref:hypothetical protein n=1 Tax=Roseofilum sp. SID1 TaxID=2821497 RepID=UPI001B2AE5C5|nr:hypothetical protein [Roseofilum sp. SID1]MBP0024516.1 hypothetical protein [Roseofilum sp. SID2]
MAHDLVTSSLDLAESKLHGLSQQKMTYRLPVPGALLNVLGSESRSGEVSIATAWNFFH